MGEAAMVEPWQAAVAVGAVVLAALAALALTGVYKHIICLKYLFCGWKAVVPVVSALPAALGVFLLILVFAVMDGFVAKMREMTRGTLSDVIVDAWLGGMPLYDEFAERIEQVPGVERATPVIQTFAVCRIRPPGTDVRVVRPCVLIGIRPEGKARMGRFTEYLERQQPEADEPPPPAADLLEVPHEVRTRREAAGRPDWPGAIAGLGLIGRPVSVREPREVPRHLGRRLAPWTAVAVGGVALAFLWRAARRRPGRTGWRVAVRLWLALVLLGAAAAALQEAVCWGRTETVVWEKVRDDKLLLWGEDFVAGTIPIRFSGAFDLGPGGIPRAQYQGLVLVDTFKSGYWEADSKYLYVDFEVAQRMAGMAAVPPADGDPGRPARASQIQVRLAEGAPAEEVCGAIRRAWGTFVRTRDLRRKGDLPLVDVNTWETQQVTILSVVETERNVTVLMLGVMLVGFAILTALISYVMAYIKQRDVGIMKAVGAGDLGVGSLFLGYGFLIGLLGTAAGLVAALLMVHYLDPIEAYVSNLLGRSVFDRTVYYFESIPVSLSGAWVAGVSLGVLALSTLASTAGGLLAALKQPVETLRYE